MPGKSLGRKSLLLLASTWGQTGIGLLVSVMIARRLGPAALGMIALNLGLAGLVIAFLAPGFNRAHLKRLAEGQDPGRCVGTMAAIQMVLIALLAVALVGLWKVDRLPGTLDERAIFLVMLASQLTGRFADIFMQVFVTREWVVDHATIQLGARVARLVVTAAVLTWAPEIVWVAATFLLETLLILTAAAAVLARRYAIRLRRPTGESVRAYWSYARPFLVTMSIALIQDSVDRFVVGRWAGLTAAGHYHVARGLWEVLSSVVAPAGLLLFTRLSSLYAERSPERDRAARALFFGGLDKLLFVTTVIAFGLWAFAGWILELLYGASFVPAATTLRILVLAALVSNIVNPYTLILQAQDQVARFIPVNLLRLVVYLAALAMLVPPRAFVTWLPDEDAGAATARLLLILFPAWVYFGWTRRLAGIPFYWRAAVYLGGFALAVATYHGALALAASVLHPGHVSEIAASALGMAVYALFLLRVHPETRANLRYARDLLSIRQFRELIRGGFSAS